MTASADDLRQTFWQAMDAAATAHVIMLRDTTLIDDSALGALLPAIATTGDAAPPALPIAQLGAIFDQRIDTAAPGEVKNVASLGRSSVDLMVTASRLVLRDHLLKQMELLAALLDEVIAFADAHAVTMMPALSVATVAQSTSLGHIASALVSSLENAGDTLWAAFTLTNRSPLGASALAGSGFPVDRGRTAELLGFDGALEQTYDAVSGVDHLQATADAIERISTPLGRWLNELMIWIRTEPTALVLDESWQVSDPAIPQWNAPGGIAALAAHARKTTGDAQTLRGMIAHLPWGPVVGELGPLLATVCTGLDNLAVLLERSTVLLRDALVVNRAYFANRAGKDFSTIADLTDFLIIEEKLDPATARGITGLVLSRLRELGLESSGISSEMIDSIAMLTFGHELRVEFETISRYLAPRRFVERRNVTGGPAPSAVRSWLAGARLRQRSARGRAEQAHQLVAVAAHLRSETISEAMTPAG